MHPDPQAFPIQKHIVEALATFFLVLTIGIAGVLGVAGHMAPLAIGLTLVALVYMGGHVSMAHYNPAITLCFFIRGRCPGSEVLPYLVAEFVGAAIGALVVRGVFDGHIMVGESTAAITRWMPGAGGPVLAAEFLFTFLLAFVILNVASTLAILGNEFYGLAIGFTVAGGTWAVGPISLASFNPAVTLGFAIMGRLGWGDIWMHLLPQILAAVLAAFAFKAIYPKDK
jgi:aquaporin Z